MGRHNSFVIPATSTAKVAATFAALICDAVEGAAVVGTLLSSTAIVPLLRTVDNTD